MVDDEIASQQVIEHFIDQVPQLEHIKSFNSPNEAFVFLQFNKSIDLIFWM